MADAPPEEPRQGLLGLPPARAQPVHDEDELFRKLVLVAVIRVTVVTLSLGVLGLLTWYGPPQRPQDVASWQYVLIGVTYALSIVYAGLLRYRILVLPLAYIQTVLDALIVSVLVLMTGGIESLFTVAYLFAVVGASLTLYRRGAVLAVFAVILMFSVVVLLQLDRALVVLPPVRVVNTVFSFFVHSIGVVMVAFLSAHLTETARITGRRLAEKQFDYEQLQELHAAILRSLPAGLMTVDGDGRIRFANESALNILGSRLDKIVDTSIEIVVPSMHAGWLQCMESGFAEPRERFEAPHTRPDETTIRLGFSFAPLSVGQVWDVPSSIVVFQDVTDIVRLKEAVERAERLATVGKFAAGLAHEVRNPLASMCASIDLLRVSLDVPDGLTKFMDNVVQEAERLNRLITDFLHLAKPRSIQLKSADLGQLVASVLSMFENDALIGGSTIERRLDEGVSAAVDSDLLRQVMWNLVRNAAEAMSDAGGVLEVEVTKKNGDPIISVRDTGPGIPEESLKHVFDPFYTTKHGGSGLGLAITHSIVEAHGAKLTVDNRAKGGAEVTIQFDPTVSAGTFLGATDDIELMSGSLPRP